MKRSAASLLACFVASGPLLAQSTTHPTTVRRPASAATRSKVASSAKPSAAGCATLPEISPKVPGLPASTGCARSMITISEGIQFSPLVSPDLRKNFAGLPTTFTLAYVDNVPGTGELAKPQMFYTVKYTGYLTDGTKFDSSYDHEETKNGLPFPYGGHRVIPGWDMGFEGMHVGGKRRLFIPYQLAYGERGRPPVIPAKAELIFDMELVSQSVTDPTPKPAAPATPTTPAPPAGAAPASPSAPTTPPAGSPTTPPVDAPAIPPSATPPPAPSSTPSLPPETKPAQPSGTPPPARGPE